MNLKFKIISVDEAEQSIVVRFYTDKITEEMLASQVDRDGNILRCRTDVNITFPDAETRPKGDALEDYILRQAPVHFFNLKEQVADSKVDTSMGDIAALVGVEQTRAVDKLEGQFIIRDKVATAKEAR